MSIQHRNFDADLLSRDEEAELARTMEAGLFAEWLLEQPGRTRYPSQDLKDMREAGSRARERMWLCNLPLVAKLARGAAMRHQLPFDDLFQDGCLGLSDAISRFDYLRGNKFSTLAHTYISRRISTSVAYRAGRVDGPAVRQRQMAQLRKSYEEQTQASREPSWKQVAANAGLSLRVAARASTRHVALHEAAADLMVTDDALEAVEGCGVGFLDIMAGYGKLLRLRYGIGCQPLTLGQLSELYAVSPTTIARMEERALERAREILRADLCRPQVGRQVESR